MDSVLILLLYVIGIIGWIILSAIIAKMARNAGKSVIGWLLLSLFFSPIVGVLFLMASCLATINYRLSQDPVEDASRRAQRGESWRCPTCQHENPSSAVECADCGHKLK